MSARKNVAEQIESLIRERKMGEDEMLHLMWIFAQEENVKITRSNHRRLLRLEKYSDETIQKVMDFLVQVEKYEAPDKIPGYSEQQQQQQQHRRGVGELQLLEERQTQARKELEKLRVQEMKRRKVNALNAAMMKNQQRHSEAVAEAGPVAAASRRLPKMMLAEDSSNAQIMEHANVASDDSAIVSLWLTKQLKITRAAKKVNPTFIAPTGDSAMPTQSRVIPKKKKRRKKTASRAAAKKKNDAALESDADDDEDEQADEAPPKSVLSLFNENDAGGGGEADQAEDEDDGEKVADSEDDDEAPVGFEAPDDEDGDGDEENDDDDNDDNDADDGGLEDGGLEDGAEEFSGED